MRSRVKSKRGIKIKSSSKVSELRVDHVILLDDLFSEENTGNFFSA